MIYSENSINILTAMTYKGIGRAWIVKNLRGDETVDTIVNLLNIDAKEDCHITLVNFDRNKERLREDVLRLEDFMDGIVAFGDERFPHSKGM